MALRTTYSTCSSTVTDTIWSPLIYPWSFALTMSRACLISTLIFYWLSIRGSWMKESRKETMFLEFLRRTLCTTSQLRWNTPFSLKIPKASMMFWVRRKGTISGIFSFAPFSKMQSKSTWVTSPVCEWMRILSPWRSPNPMTYPIIDQIAVDFTKFVFASYQISGEGKCSESHWPNTGLLSVFTYCQIKVWSSPLPISWAFFFMSCISPFTLFFFQ